MTYRQLEEATLARVERERDVAVKECQRYDDLHNRTADLCNALGHWPNELTDDARLALALVRQALRTLEKGDQ